MTIINNYNFNGGSDTESVSKQTALKRLEDCLREGKIALTPKSAEQLNNNLDNNRVIIRAGGKAVLLEINKKRIKFNDMLN